MTCTTPITRSTVSWYTGMRLLWVVAMVSITSRRDACSGTATISVRGVITSRTTVSKNSTRDSTNSVSSRSKMPAA